MQGKHILVVGGSQGIGLGITNRCLASGAEVTVLSRTHGQLTQQSGLTHVEYDVTQDGLDPSLLPQRIDGLAYCPGSINLGPLRGVKLDTMRADFELNVLGAVRVLQAAGQGLKSAESASIVLFSTLAVTQGLAMHTSVAAAKGAVEALVKTWAAEFSPKIRVNCVAPALTDTALAGRLLATEEKRSAMAKMYPLQRYGQVDDIAAAAEYLLSDASSWVTGQTFNVDGGMSVIKK